MAHSPSRFVGVNTAELRARLLPCPFCGKPPRVHDYWTADGGRHAIACFNSDCFGPHTTAVGLDDATRQWNTRAASPLPAPAAGRVISIVVPDGYKDGSDFARDCGVQLVPATGREEIARVDLPTVAALLRIVIQSFDAGGESMRSMRAQAIEAVWHGLFDFKDPAFAAANTECDRDPWAFIAKAKWALQSTRQNSPSK